VKPYRSASFPMPSKARSIAAPALRRESVKLAVPPPRGLHSSTFQLNLSALCGIGGVRRGCVARG